MIRILTSAMGLGTYVPALFLADYLNHKGISCRIQMIESYMGREKIDKFLKNKEQYHQSFKIAKLGHILAEKKLSSLLEDGEANTIIKEWRSEKTKLFVVMSGNWMDVLLRYMQLGQVTSDSVYTIHMDAGITPSWYRYSGMNTFHKFSIYDENGVNYWFEYPELFRKPLLEGEFNEKPWIYVHGGGWGMGTYRECCQNIKEKLPYHIRTTIHHINEADFSNDWEYYLLDLNWCPWITRDSGCLYPPIYRVYDSQKISRIPNELHRGMYSLYHKSCAIISKAGGGTLMDSLITATPLVFIDPIARHEEENQNLWIKLGLGIRIEDWEQENYSINTLRKLYRNILEYRKRIPGIGKEILAEIKAEGHRENNIYV